MAITRLVSASIESGSALLLGHASDRCRCAALCSHGVAVLKPNAAESSHRIGTRNGSRPLRSCGSPAVGSVGHPELVALEQKHRPRECEGSIALARAFAAPARLARRLKSWLESTQPACPRAIPLGDRRA